MYFTADIMDHSGAFDRLRKDRQGLLSKTRDFNEKRDGEVRACFGRPGDHGNLGVLLSVDFRHADGVRGYIEEFLEEMGIADAEIISYEEVSGRDFRYSAISSEDEGYIDSSCDISPWYGKSLYGECRAADYMSQIDTMYDEADLSSSDFNEEIRRIRSSKERSFCGHPVHYILVMDNDYLIRRTADHIIYSLQEKKRLFSRRVVSLSRTKRGTGLGDTSLFMTAVKAAYADNRGGSVIISAGELGEEDSDDDTTSISADELASAVTENGDEVLSFVVFSEDDTASLEAFLSRAGGTRFVTITTAGIPYDGVMPLLEENMKRDSLEEYAPTLSSVLPGERRSYSSEEVESLYSTWKRNLFNREIYPEYSSFPVSSPSGEKKGGILGSSWEKLQTMTGLESVKSLIGDIVKFSRYNSMRIAHGEKSLQGAGNMVFTGNPGTAKTTVARLFASILRENGVLSKGELIEVGRQDIVGRYMGWTAKNVEEIFRRAKGSVLFIDEAYSLTDDSKDMYGNEAVTAIVQMMENCRRDTYVIFAGYPEKMNDFLSANPGLRSRISYTVHFDDYTPFELWKILLSFAEEDGIAVSPDAMNTVMRICESAMKNEDFGNGRFVRNLYEKARMNSASEIVERGRWERMTLTSDDFTSAAETEKEEKKAVGFGF